MPETKSGMNKVSVAKYDELKDRKPDYALVGEVDPVVVLGPVT